MLLSVPGTHEMYPNWMKTRHVLYVMLENAENWCKCGLHSCILKKSPLFCDTERQSELTKLLRILRKKVLLPSLQTTRTVSFGTSGLFLAWLRVGLHVEECLEMSTNVPNLCPVVPLSWQRHQQNEKLVYIHILGLLCSHFGMVLG